MPTASDGSWQGVHECAIHGSDSMRYENVEDRSQSMFLWKHCPFARDTLFILGIDLTVRICKSTTQPDARSSKSDPWVSVGRMCLFGDAFHRNIVGIQPRSMQVQVKHPHDHTVLGRNTPRECHRKTSPRVYVDDERYCLQEG